MSRRNRVRIQGKRSLLIRAALPGVLGVGALTTALVYPQVASSSTPSLSLTSAKSVLGLALSPTGKIYSGSIKEVGNLGIPSSALSMMGSQSANNSLSNLAMAALGGSVTTNFWTNHSSEARIQIPSTNGELDVYASKTGIWEWNSTTNTATEIKPAAGSTGKSRSDVTGGDASSMPTPSTVADKIISHLPKGSTIALAAPRYIADQSSYVLSINTNDPSSLIGNIQVGVDSNSGQVLGVWVYPTGTTTPAFSSYYQSVAFTQPSPLVFDFTVPVGATQKTITLPAMSKSSSFETKHANLSSSAVAHNSYGSGFSRVEVIRFSKPGTAARPNSAMVSLLAAGTQVNTSLGSGTVVTTSLFSLFIGHNGVYAFGTVPAKVLLGDLG